jgi:Mg-chelatase subunit ChlD
MNKPIMNDKLTKSPQNGASSSAGGGLAKKPGGKVGLPPLLARAQAAQKQEQQNQVDLASMPNRLAILLDCSGSMASAAGTSLPSHSKIELLAHAYDNFITSLDFSDSTLCTETFPHTAHLSIPPTNQLALMLGLRFNAGGSTPMSRAMERVLMSYSITRGVLISDGCANSPQACLDLAQQYKSAGVSVDCCHIGTDTSGEKLLQDIAEITGGIYIKFTDAEAFARALHYLTPRYRAMLTSGEVGAKELGANEVKF